MQFSVGMLYLTKKCMSESHVLLSSVNIFEELNSKGKQIG